MEIADEVACFFADEVTSSLGSLCGGSPWIATDRNTVCYCLLCPVLASKLGTVAQQIRGGLNYVIGVV